MSIYHKPTPISDYPCHHCGSEVQLLLSAGQVVPGTVAVQSREQSQGTEPMEVSLSRAAIWRCTECPWQGTEAELAEPPKTDRQGREWLNERAIKALMKPTLEIEPTGSGGSSNKRQAKPGDKLLGKVDPTVAAWNDEVERRARVEREAAVVRIRGLEAPTDEIRAVCAKIASEEAEYHRKTGLSLSD